MTERAAQLLKLSAAFQVAHDRDVLELAALGRFVSFHEGQRVFHQGEAASSLYLVETGLLNVSRLSPTGRELTLSLSGPRQLVAGVAAFSPGAVLSSSCTALEGSSVLVLNAAQVRQLTYRSPALAEAVLTFFARRHAELLSQMEALLFSDLNARLAALLLERVPPGGDYLLPTNAELAAQLGTVPELVSRKLGEFYRLGYVALVRRTLTVLDRPALEELTGPS